GERYGWRLVFHHHDWWFDNRWQRWPELKRAGLGTLADAARWILSPAAGMRHAAINGEDAAPLVRAFGTRARWLPNPVEELPPCAASEVRQARRWLRERVGAVGPVWILPCRLLRRKNVAEALLLTRWLRPEACLVTTGGVSSADEEAYARALTDRARKESWALELGVLAREGARGPEVRALMAASEAVMLTSLVEGFGLPYLEACAARRPLVARALRNVSPDLDRMGFTFPYSYGEILVSPALFDWRRERRRQEARHARWRAGLPVAVRRMAGVPWLVATGAVPAAVPMSRLTLRAQLEVLGCSVDESWAACAPLNPCLVAWRELASRGRLRPGTWPSTASEFLGTKAYGERFEGLLKARGGGRRPVSQDAVVRAQRELLQRKVESANLYPLLWSCQP
ncbi:MAG: glycosyltransferase, partial [Verrucomicrobiales bacterium]|nr:glycosyltransferase [Verrucomicrobiales bacterium]